MPYSKKRKKFTKSAVTKELLSVYSVRNRDGIEKIVHITHCSRLIKLANFIFHIFDLDLEESGFEFSYSNKEAKSYGGYSSFRPPQKDVPFSDGVGNVCHARIDSALFPYETDLNLKIDDSSEKFFIRSLGHEYPKPHRMYPCEVKADELK